MNIKYGLTALLLLTITACGAGKEGKVEIHSTVAGLNPQLSVDVRFINTQSGNSVYSKSLSVADEGDNSVTLPLGQYRFTVDRIPDGYQCTSELNEGPGENEQHFEVICSDGAIVSLSSGVTLAGVDLSGLHATVVSPFSASIQQLRPEMIVSVLEDSVTGVDDSSTYNIDYHRLDVQLLDESGEASELQSDALGNLTVRYDSRLLNSAPDTLITVEFACADGQSSSCNLNHPMRVSLSAERFAAGAWRSNVLTEILYRKLEYPLSAGYSAAAINVELEKMAQRVVSSGSGPVNLDHVLAWSGEMSNVSHSQAVNEFATLLSQPSQQSELHQALSRAASPAMASASIGGADFSLMGLSGDYVIVAGTTAVQLFDISDIQNPALLFSHLLPDAAADLVVQDNIAYIAHQGVMVIDFNNPVSPLVHNYSEPRGARYSSIDVRNHYIYALMPDHTVILDAVQSDAITEVNDLGRSDAIHVAGDRLVMHKFFNLGYGFAVYDLAVPGNPAQLSEYITHERMWSLDHVGNILYTVQLNGPVLYDLSDASGPVKLPFSSYDPTLLSADSNDRYAIFRSNHSTEYFDPTSWERLLLYSTASPDAPVYLGNVVLEDTEIRDLAVQGDRAYVLTASGLDLVDLNATEPQFQTTLGLAGSVDSIHARNHHLYTARFYVVPDNGVFESTDFTYLDVYSLADSDHPALVSDPEAHYYVSMEPAGFVEAGSTLYFAGTFLDFFSPARGGIFAYNLSSPGMLVAEGAAFTDYEKRINRPQIFPGYLFIPEYGITGSNDDLGFSIVDIQNPVLPASIGSFALSGYTAALAVQDQYLFAASGGIQVVDLSTPAAPVLMSNFETSGITQNVLIAENLNKRYAYVLESGPNFSVLDASDPLNLTELARITFPGSADMQWIRDGHYIYAATKDLHLQIIDIQDPQLPKVMVGPSLRGAARSLSVQGGKLYVGTDYGVEVANLLAAE